VEEICKRILNERSVIFVFICLVWIGFVSNSYGEEGEKAKYGFSFLVGTPQKSMNGLTQWGFLPRLDVPLHENWDLEFEGNFSYYGINESKNLYLLGFHTNLIFKPIRWNRGFLFLIGGAGLAYNNNNSNEDRGVRDIGDSHVAGILQIGSGIQYHIGKRWWLRGEYRFYHISDPFRKDSGINTHQFILGLTF